MKHEYLPLGTQSRPGAGPAGLLLQRSSPLSLACAPPLQSLLAGQVPLHSTLTQYFDAVGCWCRGEGVPSLKPWCQKHIVKNGTGNKRTKAIQAPSNRAAQTYILGRV